MIALRDPKTGRVARTTTFGGERKCGRCGDTKDLSQFGIDRDKLFGRAYWCLECQASYRALPAIRERSSARHQERKSNPEYKRRRREAADRYRDRHADEVREKNRLRATERRAAGLQREYDRKRRATDPAYRISMNLRCRMHSLLRSASPKTGTMTLIGCTREELREHIEQQWTVGMSWGNYGMNGWHIDHIMPVADFDLLDEKQQRECFHYTNLRPLWADENRRRRWAR